MKKQKGDNMPNFGERLKALREDAEKLQSDVADDLGIQQARLSYLERQEEVPKESTVKILAKYYNVPVSYFYDDELVEPDEEINEYLDELRERPIEEKTDYDVIMHSLKFDREKIKKIREYIQRLSEEENKND